MSQQQVFSDRYQMVRHVARGGMAQVYLAKDLMLDRLVALKVLFPELSVDRSFVERFRREAKAAANLAHPNIVSIYDWGQGERTYYIVMEFVEGATLSSLLRDGPLPPQRAAAIGADVAAALDFAHRRGVIHRDVKPGNVLIDSAGQVKVTDFGIARAVGSDGDLTQTGSVMGTATYFSPEQAQGFPVDARSDVYSLGVVLYEMVTGRTPFSGDNPVSIAYKHVKEAPPRPSELMRTVPPDFEAIVLKAMEKEPSARYQTAEQLRADLIRFGSGQPVSAAADSTRVVSAVGAFGSSGAAAGGGNRPGSDPTLVQPQADGTSVIPVSGGRPGGHGQPRRSRAGLYGALAALLVLLAVGGYLGGKAAGLWGSSTKTLTVPLNLVDKTETAAMTELQQMGFTNVSTQQQSSAQVDAGKVIGTTPRGGTSVKSDHPIVLTVSSGPLPVQVPDVTGKSQADATSILQSAGFVVNSTQENSSTVDAGNVISTNPKPGATAGKGSAVQLVVSSGKAQVNIPSLVGKDPTAAGQALGALQLVPTQQTEPSDTIAIGEVTRTDPPAGAQVAVGTSVTVYVSTGPQQVKVPDVTGETQSQAQADLTSAGFKTSTTTQQVNNRKDDGVVLSQDPAAGKSADKGSTVAIVVGSLQGSTTTSTTTPGSTTSTTSQSGILPIG